MLTFPLAAKPGSLITYADASRELSSPECQALAQLIMRSERKVDELQRKVDEVLCEVKKQRPTNETSSPNQLSPMLQPQQPINQVPVELLEGEQLLQMLMNSPAANQHQRQQIELPMNFDQTEFPDNPSSSGYPSLPGPSISVHFSQPGLGCSSVPGPSYSTSQMSYGLLESGWSTPLSSSQPNSHSGTGPYGLDHPEKILSRIPGNDRKTLCKLTVELARYVVFGDEVLARSSVSGRNNKDQLDPDKLKHIKSIIRERAWSMGDNEFDLVWQKCLEKLGRTCRKLRSKPNAK